MRPDECAADNKEVCGRNTMVDFGEYTKHIDRIRRLTQERRDAYAAYRTVFEDDGQVNVRRDDFEVPKAAQEHFHERMYWADRKLRLAHLGALKCLATLVPDPDLFCAHLGVVAQTYTPRAAFCADPPSFDPAEINDVT